MRRSRSPRGRKFAVRHEGQRSKNDYAIQHPSLVARTAWTRGEVFDAPISKPDQDLLGAEPYALHLAAFIEAQQAPFTSGIYGPWGSGKTSMVQLVEHRLLSGSRLERYVFVSSAAGAYRTSDDQWRAFVLRVAEVLFSPKGRSE